MRKLISFALIFLAGLAMIRCDKDETAYYSALGILEISNDTAIFESDNGTRMLVKNFNNLDNIEKDRERIIAYFTLVDEPLPADFDLAIEIYDLEKVLFKPVLELTEEIADSIGNDRVDVGNLWLVKDILNLNFMYYGANKQHYINLIRYPGEIPEDTIHLEIRHNENDDPPSYYYSGFVSFDLIGLQHDVADSVVLCITAKEYDNGLYKKCFTYTY
jgi:hypothetical protein